MPLDAARDALETEHQKVLAERDAFQEFERLLADVTPSQPAGNPAKGAAQLLSGGGTDDGLRRVREAYESTLMSVEHYEEEYDEDFLEHVEAEFGADFAAVLRSATRLTPELQRQLSVAAAQIRGRRTGFATVLEEEAERLDRAEAFLAEVRPLPEVSEDLAFEELREIDDRQREYETRTENRLCERQQHLHRSSAGTTRSNRIDPKSLNHYLYDPLDTTYPVLEELVRLLTDIRTARAAVAHHIATYHG